MTTLQDLAQHLWKAEEGARALPAAIDEGAAMMNVSAADKMLLHIMAKSINGQLDAFHRLAAKVATDNGGDVTTLSGGTGGKDNDQLGEG